MEAKLQQTSQKTQTNKPNLTGIPTQMKARCRILMFRQENTAMAA